MSSLTLPEGLDGLPSFEEGTLRRLIARRVGGVRLQGVQGQPLEHLDLSGSELDHEELQYLRDLPLQSLRLTGATLIDVERLRQALQAAAAEDLAARMVLSEAWEERFEFRWETHGEDFEVQDQGPLPALGEEDQVPVPVPTEERRRRLKEAAELYDLDLRAIHGPLSGVAALADLHALQLLSLSWTPVGDEEVSALAALPLKVLEVAGTDVRSPRWPGQLRSLDAFGCSVERLPPVQELRLGGIGVGGSLSWPTVQSLALHECRIRDMGLGMPELRQLTLHGSHIDHLDGLGGVPLEVLDLGRCTVDDWRGLCQLRARVVRLSRSSIDDEALEHLVQLRCEVLDLGLSRLHSVEALRAALPDTEVRHAGLLVPDEEAP